MLNDDNYTHHYKKWHSTEIAHLENMKAFYRKALSHHFPSQKEARIIDVGCGMGFLLLTLQSLGYTDLTGIDIDAGQVAVSKELGLNAIHTPDSAKFLRSHAQKFDAMFAIDVIEHITPENQVEFVKAMYEALAPGGVFVCTVPNGNSALAGRWRYIDWTHQTAFTEHSLEFLLHSAGFEKIEVGEVLLFKKYDAAPSLVQRIAENVVHRAMRGFRRLEMISELGFDEGLKIPLSVNVLARGVRP